MFNTPAIIFNVHLFNHVLWMCEQSRIKYTDVAVNNPIYFELLVVYYS